MMMTTVRDLIPERRILRARRHRSGVHIYSLAKTEVRKQLSALHLRASFSFDHLPYFYSLEDMTTGPDSWTATPPYSRKPFFMDINCEVSDITSLADRDYLKAFLQNSQIGTVIHIFRVKRRIRRRTIERPSL